jgi:pumilio family protein 6
LFRSIKELFDNEYGRKVITYLVAPRDSKFFLKDYVKRLEKGDNTETSKKDPEKRREELLDHVKPFFKNFINKEIQNLLYNGPVSILVPFVLEKLGKDGDEIIQKIAEILLEKEYEPTEKNSKAENGAAENAKLHPIEDATVHFVTKKILEIQPKSSLSKIFRPSHLKSK